MLEILKQLQVKPQAPSAQVEICNQKSARDCHFLEGLQLCALVLHAHAATSASPSKSVLHECSGTFSETPCKRLS